MTTLTHLIFVHLFLTLGYLLNLSWNVGHTCFEEKRLMPNIFFRQADTNFEMKTWLNAIFFAKSQCLIKICQANSHVVLQILQMEPTDTLLFEMNLHKHLVLTHFLRIAVIAENENLFMLKRFDFQCCTYLNLPQIVI